MYFTKSRTATVSTILMAISTNIGAGVIAPIKTTAQLIPDDTLGTESTIVTPQDLQQSLIEGGAVRDSNLFHSFREFNIDRPQQVNFANPDGIANILTRVTGNNASNIFGTLGVNGNANLFLINPNGIIFGEGASIDLNGSFFATTADSINFADEQNFSAVNPESSLLTINIPLGVQFGSDPASIQAQQANINVGDVSLIGGDINLERSIINTPTGKVELSSLAEGGIVNFNSDFPSDLLRGNINLSDLSSIETISDGGGDITINANNLSLNDSDIIGGIRSNRGTSDAVSGDIYLNIAENIVLNNSNISNNLELNSLGNSGTIQIDTTNLVLNNSKILSDTKSIGNAGDIMVNASGKVEVFSNPESADEDNFGNPNLRKGIFSLVTPDGRGNGGNINITSPEISLFGLGGIDSSTTGIGNAGSINIQSDRVIVKEGATIAANGRGIGDGGDVEIIATEFIELSDGRNSQPDRNRPPLPGGIIVDVGEGSQSNGGNITLETKRLTVRSGAFIAAGTKGSGNAGNISINATESIEVSDRQTFRVASQIVSAARRNTTGQGGQINIQTKNLIVRDGAMISVATDSTGNAGDLSILATGTIELEGSSLGIPSTLSAQVGRNATGQGGNIFITAQNLSVDDGGQISASTLGTGKGGSVTVEVVEDITIANSTLVSEETAGFGGSILIKNNARTTFPSGIFASAPGLGNADALSIQTGNLALDNGAQISVSSQQQGAAGNLSIDADNINLTNSILSAETVEGENANISIDTSNLQLGDSSLITTNATQTATGGNINIDTDILLALDNSDITANARDNFGGRVSIDARGIFGIEAREFLTPQSDITATSLLGAEFSGIVELDISDPDPTKGIIKLPTNSIDASQQITSSCKLNRDNNFAITGKGGIASSPQSFLRGQTILQDWRMLADNSPQKQGEISIIKHESLSIAPEQPEVVEAQTWIVNHNNKVELVASLPQSDNLREMTTLPPWQTQSMRCARSKFLPSFRF